jgi:tocopherol cyclase
MCNKKPSSEKPNYSTLFDKGSFHTRIKYSIRKIWNPEWFQGNNKKKNYFEGWYFKNVSNEGTHCWSFIPGVSLVGEDAHAFIQAINGNTGETWYFRFPLESFSFSSSSFAIKIDKNTFAKTGFSLDINQNGQQFKGNVLCTNAVTYPANLQRPGIMGWYRYVPFMECYHGVVSLHHTLMGNLNYNGTILNFDNGNGYIEKDWGTSMPSAWVWMQTNHFAKHNTSFMFSVARIPWIGKNFTGFLGFFYHENKIITFATYTGDRLVKLENERSKVKIEVQGKKYRLLLEGTNNSHGPLKAPILGKMDRIIHESIDAKIYIKLTTDTGETIFEGTGKNAGLEMVGDLHTLY